MHVRYSDAGGARLYKVILVDDETVVREGLQKTIQWGDHGFELIGDYANGRDAWEAIEKRQPDLVISDISMPFMDGLELAGMVTAQYPYIKMIILTGFDEFEYAQKALRLKVADFILKPVTAREIRELLDKTRATMDDERKNREDLSLLYTQLHQSLPLLKERLLERLVVLGLGKPEIEERFTYFELPPLVPPYLIVVADIDDFGNRDAMWNEHDAEFLKFAAFNIFEESAQSDNAKVISFRTREERMVAIFFGQPDERVLYEQAFAIAEQIRFHVESFLRFTITIGVGRICFSAEQLPVSYRSALSALDYRFLHGKNRVLSIVDMEGTPAQISAEPAPGGVSDWDRRLATVVKTGSPQEAQQLIGELITRLKESRQPMDGSLLLLQKVVFALMDTVQELGIADNPALNFDLSDRQRWLADVYRFKTLGEIEHWLKQLVGSVMAAISDNRSSYMNTQMARAAEYIESNYANEKMTLHDLCRHVLMSSSYFSLVFKQHTGETFVEYLTRVRIVKAKELLQTTSLKFYEIAERVGYGDPNYFSILFKKHTGQTPRDYREKQSKESER